MKRPRIQTTHIIFIAFLIFQRSNLNWKTMHIRRSTVITDKVNTETSLDIVDNTPANLHRSLARQDMSCLKYTPCNSLSLYAIINMYTPIKKSATARLARRNELTRFASFETALHITTTKLPRNAMRPRTHIEYLSTVFFRSSSQLEIPACFERHEISGLACLA